MGFSHWTVCLSILNVFARGSNIPSIKLSNGNWMPTVGFGTYKIKPEHVNTALTSALQNGYRLIDTSYIYQNEKEIGNVLDEWILNGGRRENLFISGKLQPQALRPEDVSRALESSLKKLKLDYYDLYLIHLPFTLSRTADFQPIVYENGTFAIDTATNHIAIWKELEKQVQAGRVRSIGVSNFNATQLLKLWRRAKIKPSNLQVETNPYLPQRELLHLCRRLGISFTAYSPLGSSDTDHLRRRRDVANISQVIDDPVVVKIAREHDKSPAQVLLRFGHQRRIIVIPKSKRPKRIKENREIFNFRLTSQDMEQLKALDKHGKYRKFDFLTVKGVEHHPEYPFTDRVSKLSF